MAMVDDGRHRSVQNTDNHLICKLFPVKSRFDNMLTATLTTSGLETSIAGMIFLIRVLKSFNSVIHIKRNTDNHSSVFLLYLYIIIVVRMTTVK